MTYDYVKRTYGVDPKIGARVQHIETKKFGKITREKPSAAHYVNVTFDGLGFSMPCHPTALDYAPVEDALVKALDDLANSVFASGLTADNTEAWLASRRALTRVGQTGSQS